VKAADEETKVEEDQLAVSSDHDNSKSSAKRSYGYSQPTLYSSYPATRSYKSQPIGYSSSPGFYSSGVTGYTGGGYSGGYVAKPYNHQYSAATYQSVTPNSYQYVTKTPSSVSYNSRYFQQAPVSAYRGYSTYSTPKKYQSYPASSHIVGYSGADYYDDSSIYKYNVPAAPYVSGKSYEYK
jgi:hypothetical protein